MLLFTTIKIKKKNELNHSLIERANWAPFSNASVKTSSSGTKNMSNESVTLNPASSKFFWSFEFSGKKMAMGNR